MTGNDHLGDTLAVIDDEIFLREVDKYYAYLSTIVCINRTWCIQHGQSVLQGQSAAGTHLCLIAFRQGDMQSRRNQTTLQRMKCDRFVDIRTKIHACTLQCGISGQLLVPFVDNFYLNHFEMFL